MQTKSAIILGLSFVIGMIVSYLIQKFPYDYDNLRFFSISVNVSKTVEVDGDCSAPQISPEIYAELFEQSRKQAEALARAGGRQLGKSLDVFVEKPYCAYESDGRNVEDGKTKKATVNLAASFKAE
jgi:hypothetical protein